MSEPESERMSEPEPGGKPRAGSGPDADDAPAEAIVAIPLRHPWRILIAVVLVLGLAVFLLDAAQRSEYGWPDVGKYIFDRRISQAAWVTLWLTIYAMVGAIVIGLLLAVMRLSPNPVLKSAAWVYIWIFRGTPVYVQLVFWGLFTSIYRQVDIGIPFAVRLADHQPAGYRQPLHVRGHRPRAQRGRLHGGDCRAGISSVGEGQTEASVALAMTWSQTMRRTVLPQAMEIIIPPTGNEVISMLKTTSLVTAVPLTTDLYSSVAGHLGCELPADPAADSGGRLVSVLHQHLDGGPVLPGEALRSRFVANPHQPANSKL